MYPLSCLLVQLRTNIIIIALIISQDLVVEEEGEEVGGGRRKKMRTTFTGKQVDLFMVHMCIYVHFTKEQ